MTNLTTFFGAQLNALTQDVRQLRVRLAVLIAEKEEAEATSRNFSDDIEARLKALEDAENYRQQDEDVERSLGRSAETPVHVTVRVKTLVDRVAFAITGDADGPINWKPEARAAILAVARWMDENQSPVIAEWLETEANRD